MDFHREFINRKLKKKKQQDPHEQKAEQELDDLLKENEECANGIVFLTPFARWLFYPEIYRNWNMAKINGCLKKISNGYLNWVIIAVLIYNTISAHAIRGNEIKHLKEDVVEVKKDIVDVNKDIDRIIYFLFGKKTD